MRIEGDGARRLIGWVRAVALALCCLALVGCNQQALLEKITAPEDRALAVRMIERVQAGDSAYVSQQMASEYRDQLAQVLPAMRQAIPSGPGAQVRLINASARSDTAAGVTTRRAQLVYEVDQGARHAVVEIVILHSGGQTVVEGFHVNPVSRPADQIPAFELSGKPAWQYLFLALAIAAPVTCLWGFVAVLRTRRLRLKWLWAIGCLLGVVTFSLNWTTGAIGIQPLSFLLLGASVFAPLGGDGWTIGFALPVVAIVFLVRRATRRQAAVADAF